MLSGQPNAQDMNSFDRQLKRHDAVCGRFYTVNHKKGGSTFVTITLENLDRFL